MSNNESIEFNAIPEAIEDIRAGKFVVVVDDEDRENEGDLIMVADKVTPEHVNFMAKYGRGLICVCMTTERIEQLSLHPMVEQNTALLGTRFTVSVDAVKGTTTGISAHDRSHTIKVLADDNTRPNDLARPGHVFPIRALKGGVLRLLFHTVP